MSSEQAVRLLRTMGMTYEADSIDPLEVKAGVGKMKADIALIAMVLADHIAVSMESATRFRKPLDWTLQEHGETLRRLGGPPGPGEPGDASDAT